MWHCGLVCKEGMAHAGENNYEINVQLVQPVILEGGSLSNATIKYNCSALCACFLTNMFSCHTNIEILLADYPLVLNTNINFHKAPKTHLKEQELKIFLIL